MKALLKIKQFGFENYPNTFEIKDGYVYASWDLKWDKVHGLMCDIIPDCKNEMMMTYSFPVKYKDISFLKEEEQNEFNSLVESFLRNKAIKDIIE
jgi:hypothetical protein